MERLELCDQPTNPMEFLGYHREKSENYHTSLSWFCLNTQTTEATTTTTTIMIKKIEEIYHAIVYLLESTR